jgi:hypothetical protein
MIRWKASNAKRWTIAVLLVGVGSQFGMIGSCNKALLETTAYVDPCGTIFGNCEPGDFQAYNSDIGNYCLDPVCTLPGGCDNEDPPLGTQYDLCP